MSIDIHEACKALRDVQLIIDPEDDYLTIVAAEESITTKDSERRKELESTHMNARTLAKILEAARISSTRPPSVLSAEAHATAMNELDSNRLFIAKAISDTETLLGTHEATLSNLKADAKKQEHYDPATEHQRELDGAVLRLQIFRGFGFEPIVGINEISKMLIKSGGDVHVVETHSLNPNFDQTQFLWNLS